MAVLLHAEVVKLAVPALGLEVRWKYVYRELSSSKAATDSSTAVGSSDPDALAHYSDRFVQTAPESLKLIQAGLQESVSTPPACRVDATSVFAVVSAGSSDHNACAAEVAGLKLSQLTFTKVSRSLQTGWLPPHCWHSKV